MKGIFSLFRRKHNDAPLEVLPEYPCHCGHSSPERVVLKKGLEQQTIQLAFNEGGLDYCKACLEAMIYSCPWCHNPIWLGSPVVLGSPEGPLKKGYTYYQDPQTKRYLYCGRHSAWVGDIAGYWDIPGMINRISFVKGPSGITRVFEYSQMGRVQIKNPEFQKLT